MVSTADDATQNQQSTKSIRYESIDRRTTGHDDDDNNDDDDDDNSSRPMDDDDSKEYCYDGIDVGNIHNDLDDRR